jgi:hypothetical protein
MARNRRHFGRRQQKVHAFQQSKVSFKSGMNFLWKSAKDWSKPSSSTKGSMTKNIVRFHLMSVSGFGSGSSPGLIASLDVRGRGKLGPKFYGPFRIMEKIGNVAYRLQLPAGSKLHDVFHVGLLKQFKGEPPALPTIRHGQACAEPKQVCRGRLACGRREVLVQWKGQPAMEATWVDLEKFRKLYPTVQLEDELLLAKGG